MDVLDWDICQVCLYPGDDHCVTIMTQPYHWLQPNREVNYLLGRGLDHVVKGLVLYTEDELKEHVDSVQKGEKPDMTPFGITRVEEVWS